MIQKANIHSEKGSLKHLYERKNISDGQLARLFCLLDISKKFKNDEKL